LTEKKRSRFNFTDPDKENKLIILYPDVTYQEIEGFGGAFTEAAAVTLQTLPRQKQTEILNAYFNPKNGLGYSLCRTHINSCDFSLGNYAYADKPNDTTLSTFSIERDQKALIPMIQKARKIRGAEFKLFASPWSPPAWMKTNGMMNQGGKLKSKYAAVWAHYFVKYIKAYAEQGISLWGLTVQNEAKATQPWDSCVYTAEEERDFVRDHLGPVLRKNGLGHIKIMVWDHNKERVYERAQIALADKKAAQTIWGLAFHWYSGDHFDNLEMTHKMFPGHKLLFTEGCQEGGPKPGIWKTGERYGHDIIGNLNHYAVGFVDWNMLLNEQGGPNHVGNFCDAPILANPSKKQIIYNSSYYYIGHFSRFIRPGAVRIGCSRYTDQLEATAFKNPEGSLVTVVLNRTDETIDFNLRIGTGFTPFQSLPHSIITLIC